MKCALPFSFASSFFICLQQHVKLIYLNNTFSLVNSNLSLICRDNTVAVAVPIVLVIIILVLSIFIYYYYKHKVTIKHMRRALGEAVVEEVGFQVVAVI